MSYEPKSVVMRRRRDQILAALREHGEMTTTELCTAIGFDTLERDSPYPLHCDSCGRAHHGPIKRRVTSAALQGTLVGMTRAGEVLRGDAPAPKWPCTLAWSIGPDAPEPVDLSELEQMLDA